MPRWRRCLPSDFMSDALSVSGMSVSLSEGGARGAQLVQTAPEAHERARQLLLSAAAICAAISICGAISAAEIGAEIGEHVHELEVRCVRA